MNRFTKAMLVSSISAGAFIGCGTQDDFYVPPPDPGATPRPVVVKFDPNLKTIEKLIFTTANHISNLNLSPHIVDIPYRPELWEAYEYNPFSRIDGTK